MVALVRHSRRKRGATDRPDLTPPRQSSTLHPMGAFILLGEPFSLRPSPYASRLSDLLQRMRRNETQPPRALSANPYSVANVPMSTDATGLVTAGGGIGFLLNAIIVLGTEVLLVADGFDNWGVLFCPMIGVGFGAEFGLGGVAQFTTACTICELEGPSVEVGFTVGFPAGPVKVGGGIDLVRGATYVGVEVQAGASVGAPLPGEFHVVSSWCTLLWQNNKPCLKSRRRPRAQKPPAGALAKLDQALDQKIRRDLRKKGFPKIRGDKKVVARRDLLPSWPQGLKNKKEEWKGVTFED